MPRRRGGQQPPTGKTRQEEHRSVSNAEQTSTPAWIPYGFDYNSNLREDYQTDMFSSNTPAFTQAPPQPSLTPMSRPYNLEATSSAPSMWTADLPLHYDPDHYAQEASHFPSHYGSMLPMAMSPYADPTPSYEQSQWLPDSANAFSIPQTHYPPTQYDYHTPQPSAYTSASISHNPDPSSHNTAAVSPNPSSGASSNTQQQQQQQTSSPSMPRPTLVQLGASQNYLVNNRPAPWIKVLDVDPTYRPSRPPSPRNAPALCLYIKPHPASPSYHAIYLRTLTVHELIARVVEKYNFPPTAAERAKVVQAVRVVAGPGTGTGTGREGSRMRRRRRRVRLEDGDVRGWENEREMVVGVVEADGGGDRRWQVEVWAEEGGEEEWYWGEV